jgi:drug/metabolite transporter (DMT)-like permease
MSDPTIAHALVTGASSVGRSPYAGFDGHARSAALAAALALSCTGILFALSEASPSTATVLRCAYALPFLWWLARREDRLTGGRPWRARRWALLAGMFFAIDLVLFHRSVQLMGAGLATVMSNFQVVIVVVAAWLIWGERPSLRQGAGVPIALVGIVLISGILDAAAYGADPVTGSLLGILVAAAYAAYLLLIRKGRDRLHAAGPIFDATLACGAAGLAFGLLAGDLEPVPTIGGHVDLLLMALSAQVAASPVLTLS